MTKTESGEIEMVLGSKQLLSVFFIVVILLGVFFAIGYIVGRNSNPPQIVDTGNGGSLPRAAAQPEGAGNPAEASRNGNPPRGPDESTPLVVTPADRAAPNQKPDPVAAPKERASEPAELRPAVESKQKPAPAVTKEKAESKKDEPDQRARKEDKKTAAVDTGKVSRGAPRSGHYLQLAAIPEKDATLLAQVLQRKGFDVQLSASGKDDLQRVLIGPVAEKKDLTKMRASLDEAGFDGKKAIARKYGASAN